MIAMSNAFVIGPLLEIFGANHVILIGWQKTNYAISLALVVFVMSEVHSPTQAFGCKASQRDAPPNVEWQRVRLAPQATSRAVLRVVTRT